MANITEQGKAVDEIEAPVLFDQNSVIVDLMKRSIEQGEGGDAKRRERLNELLRTPVGEDSLPPSLEGYKGLPHLNYGNVVLGESDAVNYEQIYFEQSIENARKIVELVETHNLKPNNQELFEKLKADIARKDLSAWQQFRTFDARDKVQEDGARPIAIDIKGAPDPKTPNKRAKLSFAAKTRGAEGENPEKSITTVIDQLKSDLDGKYGQMTRYFMGYEWVPPTVYNAFNLTEILKGIDAETAQKIYKKIGEDQAVKIDGRFDINKTPKGVETKTLTGEVEIPNLSEEQQETPKAKAAVKLVSKLASEALKGHGTLYDAGKLDASILCLHDDPRSKVVDVMKKAGKEDGEIEKFLKDSADCVDKVSGILKEAQLTVPDQEGEKKKRLDAVKRVVPFESTRDELVKILNDSGSADKAAAMQKVSFAEVA